jgi:two-component system cell cycle sensor histidine kinase/response regulator CckA
VTLSQSKLPDPDFKALFESVPGLYLVLQPDLTIVAASEAYIRATMMKRDELLGRHVFDAFPDNPDDPNATGVANLSASLHRVILDLVPDAMAVQKYDIRRPTSEGGAFEVRYWSPMNSPVLHADGSLAYIIHRVEDVTEFVRLTERETTRNEITDQLRARTREMETEVFLRAQQVQEANRRLRAANDELSRLYEKTKEEAVESLREERNFIAAVLETAGALVVVLDSSDRIIRVNRAAEACTGYPFNEACGKTFVQVFVAPDELEAARAVLVQIRSGRYPVQHENVCVAKDGTRKRIAWSTTALLDPDGKISHGIATGIDMTEKSRLEDMLRQAQRMEVVGELAGGIAHDFNNLLTAIVGYSDLLLQRLPPNDASRGEISEILRAGSRASEMTRQLLAFSRQQVLQPKVLDLNTVVSEMGKMLRRLIGEHIELVTALHPDLARTLVDPGQLEQVILNLAVNARDAMPNGGKLIIETGNVEVDETYAQQHPGARVGRHVMLGVSDTGTGMDAATQARLFEPFFTTKEQGKGTGLGLSTVYGIVKQSGGNIWVYSEPGHGAMFKVFLPTVEAPLSGTERRPPAHARQPGWETIVLAEDAEQVRSFVQRVLEKEGYRVLVAKNGDEALAIATDHEGPIHLLVTDVIMPKKSGRELADQLLRLRPDTRVLFMSGYTNRAYLGGSMLDPDVPFIQKPFTSVEIVSKIRELLDRPHSAHRPSARM